MADGGDLLGRDDLRGEPHGRVLLAASAARRQVRARDPFGGGQRRGHGQLANPGAHRQELRELEHRRLRGGLLDDLLAVLVGDDAGKIGQGHGAAFRGRKGSRRFVRHLAALHHARAGASDSPSEAPRIRLPAAVAERPRQRGQHNRTMRSA